MHVVDVYRRRPDGVAVLGELSCGPLLRSLTILLHRESLRGRARVSTVSHTP